MFLEFHFFINFKLVLRSEIVRSFATDAGGRRDHGAQNERCSGSSTLTLFIESPTDSSRIFATELGYWHPSTIDIRRCSLTDSHPLSTYYCPIPTN